MQTFHGRLGRLVRAAIIMGIATAWTIPGGTALSAESGGNRRVLLIKTQRFEEVGAIVASRVDKALGTALALESKIELVLPDGLEDAAPAAPVAAPVTDETLLKAGKVVDQAKEEFSKGKFMAAAKTFGRAMGLYEKKIALLENFDLYVDAQLGKSLAYFAAGYDDNGEDELGKVLTLRPTLVLDKRRTPKAATEALARLQLLYARAQSAPVMVEAKGGVAASVYVDGVLVGAAPANLDKLLRGRHWVRVVADGYEPWADDVMASAKPQTLTAKLKAIRQTGKGPVVVAAATPDELAEAARTGGFGKAFDKSAAGLCGKYGLTGVMMTYVTKAQDGYRLAGFYFDARAGKTTEVEGVRIDPELFDLQVNALTLSEHLVGAATGFPTKVSITQTPEVYRLAEAEAAKAEAARVAAAKAEAERLEAERAE
ncbi:MAG: PEGA domain-containing protein, partial [Deltaproteobacteria bacterium]